jgi:hypothetical protein
MGCRVLGQVHCHCNPSRGLHQVGGYDETDCRNECEIF